MKKAQGLPITTIVLAIVGLLVLFVLIAFFSGGFGKAARTATQVSGGELEAKITNARNQCSQLCLQASPQDVPAQKVSVYCKKPIWIDLNGDSKVDNNADNPVTKETGLDGKGLSGTCVEPSDGDELLCCWQDPIGSQCPGVPSCF